MISMGFELYCCGLADMVSKCAAQDAGGSEGAPKLGQSDG